MITSSTCPLFAAAPSAGVSAKIAWIAYDPRWGACTFDRPPKNLPMGVRFAARITGLELAMDSPSANRSIALSGDAGHGPHTPRFVRPPPLDSLATGVIPWQIKKPSAYVLLYR